MTKEMFIRSILPIGVLFSGSLILSNTAYLYLSVAYIQMLKVINMLFTTSRSILTIVGIHPCRNPSHILDIPYPRPK